MTNIIQILTATAVNSPIMLTEGFFSTLILFGLVQSRDLFCYSYLKSEKWRRDDANNAERSTLHVCSPGTCRECCAVIGRFKQVLVQTRLRQTNHVHSKWLIFRRYNKVESFLAKWPTKKYIKTLFRLFLFRNNTLHYSLTDNYRISCFGLDNRLNCRPATCGNRADNHERPSNWH